MVTSSLVAASTAPSDSGTLRLESHYIQLLVIPKSGAYPSALMSTSTLAACRREQSTSHASRSSRAHLLDGTSRDDEQKAVTARARAEMRAESTGRRPNLLH